MVFQFVDFPRDSASHYNSRSATVSYLKEEGGGYIYFWKGKPQTEDRIHGVGFAIRLALLKSLPALPVGIKERLMKRLP